MENNSTKINVDDALIQLTLKEKGKMLAKVDITFDHLKIKGFRVMSSDYGSGYFVAPPSIPPTHFVIIYIEDREQWKKLETRIIDEYKKAKREFDEETSDISDKTGDTLDLNSLPF